MQEKPTRRSNAARSEATRAALIGAARGLFAAKGFHETGAPEIVAAAGVTRGALHHHFGDKTGLFHAVAAAESHAVACDISQSALAAPDAAEALLAGADAYFDAMSAPGRAQILLIDGPTVLGLDEMARINAETDAGALRLGLKAAGVADGDVLDALTVLLATMFDRAALAIAGGADRAPWRDALALTLRRIAPPPIEP